MNSANKLFWPMFVLSIFLFFYPFPKAPGESIGLDKLVHIVIFLLLQYYGLAVFAKKRFLLTLAIALYPPAVEYLQRYIFTYRNFSWLDMLSGWIGLALGLLIFYLFAESKIKHETSQH